MVHSNLNVIQDFHCSTIVTNREQSSTKNISSNSKNLLSQIKGKPLICMCQSKRGKNLAPGGNNSNNNNNMTCCYYCLSLRCSQTIIVTSFLPCPEVHWNVNNLHWLNLSKPEAFVRKQPEKGKW